VAVLLYASYGMAKKKPQKSAHVHWHYVYKRRRKLNGVSTRQILVGQIIALMGSLTAGYLLELNKDTLLLFASAYLLLPGLIDLSASITGVVCAKINHRLELGEKTSKVLFGSDGFGLLSAVFSGLIVGVTGGILGEIFFDTTFWQVLLLTAFVMPIVSIIVFPIVNVLLLFLRKMGYNPDNIIGPIETGLTDALTVFVVTLGVRLIV
jgi:cation transporter-like permease